MSKAIQGAAMLAGAVGMGAAAFIDPALAGSVLFDEVMKQLVVGGIAMEAGAIAGALTQNRGMGITTRQPAGLRQVIYGTQRVPGNEIYRSTTGSHHDQFNYIIVLAGHVVDAIETLYLDGRQVFWQTGSGGNVTRNGVNFGGSADNDDHIGPGGQHYNFGTLVYCEARFGDQSDGDVISGMTANDPNWAADGLGNSPWAGGCTYVYLKVEYDQSMFPGEPEIRFTIRGKADIYDPRTNTRGFTNNWALVISDVIEDPTFGLGDLGSVNEDQLIAAANVCDEQVTLAIGGTESRYCCDWHYDTGAAPADVLATMMKAAAGRLSRVGGEWYIYPAYWQGPSFSFDSTAFTAAPDWTSYRSLRELINRVNGTYIAPNSPWNVAGNLYDANGWYDGSIANQFPYAFTPTNYPQYAADTLHGYSSDAYLEEDSGVQGDWESGLTYAQGDVVTYSSVIYLSLLDSNTGNEPDTATDYWKPWSNQLPLELAQECVLSVSQAQRVAKINLLRNRQQGSGTFELSLDGWQMMPLDVMQFTFQALGWTNKQLEITSVKFRIEEGKDEGDAPSVRVTFGVQETDETVYEWSATEDLPPTDVPSNPTISPYLVDAPTDLSLLSDDATAIVGADGVNIPRILATWVPSDDVLVALTEIQYRPETSPASDWIEVGTVEASTTSVYIQGIVVGEVYDVRIRALRGNGAASDWVEVDGVTAGGPSSLQSTYANDPQFALSQPSSTEIDLAAVAVSFGGRTAVNYNARSFTIPAPSEPTWYYVTISDAMQAGDSSPELTATCQDSDALVGVQGNTYLGAILALPAGSATNILPGGWPAPQAVQVGD